VTEKLLKKVAPHAVVLHPGPMNRGVEISSDVADGPRSLIGSQVNMGVAVRMAVLFKVGRGQLHE
jgi:aspartate carbamoyltransferase catalytic subunit